MAGRLRDGRDDAVLTYYVAYYLPAALVGKIAGWTAANVVLFTWSAAGAALAFLWLVVLSEAPVWRCLAIFVLFSGLDLVGAATLVRPVERGRLDQRLRRRVVGESLDLSR